MAIDLEENVFITGLHRKPGKHVTGGYYASYIFVGEKFCYQKPILNREKIDKKDQYISLVLIGSNCFSERCVLDRYCYGELDRDFVYELQLLDYPDPLDPPARRR